jgi:hypothetical protein
MFITEESKRAAGEISARFFLIDAAGGFARLNNFGKATSWCFWQRSQAVRLAARRGVACWDSERGEFL